MSWRRRSGNTFVLPAMAADAAVLWIVHTHAFDLALFTPRLAFLSPEKRCGKSTALRPGRNDRIKTNIVLSRYCVIGTRLESILLGKSPKSFFDSIDPVRTFGQAKMCPHIHPACGRALKIQKRSGAS
jgi:hypothetical protein